MGTMLTKLFHFLTSLTQKKNYALKPVSFFNDLDTEKELCSLLPPKLYLVVFYQVSLVTQTGITFSDFRRPLEVLLGSACCTISHVHTPWGNCNKCSSMIVSVK